MGEFFAGGRGLRFDVFEHSGKLTEQYQNSKFKMRD
jgi:hypothetical protein